MVRGLLIDNAKSKCTVCKVHFIIFYKQLRVSDLILAHQPTSLSFNKGGETIPPDLIIPIRNYFSDL